MGKILSPSHIFVLKRKPLSNDYAKGFVDAKKMDSSLATFFQIESIHQVILFIIIKKIYFIYINSYIIILLY
jgi:hypothetical protein